MRYANAFRAGKNTALSAKSKIILQQYIQDAFSSSESEL